MSQYDGQGSDQLYQQLNDLELKQGLSRVKIFCRSSVPRAQREAEKARNGVAKHVLAPAASQAGSTLRL